MEAQVVLQNQWGNILHHIMGITAAMEVWQPDAAASSSSQGGENHSGGEPTGASCSDEGDEADPANQPPQVGHTAAEGDVEG